LDQDTTAPRVVHVSSGDVEPYQFHNARRARIDVQHTALIREAGLCIQHDRACHRRLEDDAPDDAELSAECVGAGGEENAVDVSVGECTGQAKDGAHRPWGRYRRRRRRWRHDTRAAVGAVSAANAV
jgi:hypothetical protein